MSLIITARIREKLAAKHQVSEEEILEAFANRSGKMLLDLRAEHRTNPPTWWFVSETNSGRKLKVAFVKQRNGDIAIKTAYTPSQNAQGIYNRDAY